MSNVNGKYLRDENNNIFSPITHIDCIMSGGGLGAPNKFG
jgi:hypothetical protein